MSVECNDIRCYLARAQEREGLKRDYLRARGTCVTIAARLGCDVDEIHEALDALGIPRVYRGRRTA